MQRSRGSTRAVWWTLAGASIVAAVVGTWLASAAYTRAYDTSALEIPPGSDSLLPCVAAKEPVQVADLATSVTLRDCNPEGVKIVLPDGVIEVVPAVGGVVGSGDPTAAERVVFHNWGVPGIGVLWQTREGTEVWGTTPAAVEHEIRAEAYTLEHGGV